jgi:hypothetical protein
MMESRSATGRNETTLNNPLMSLPPWSMECVGIAQHATDHWWFLDVVDDNLNSGVHEVEEEHEPLHILNTVSRYQLD